MNIIIWLIVGGIVGWLASLIMRTDAQQGIILNVIVGIVGARLTTAIAGWPTIISLDSIVSACIFSLAVGLFFGLYPANKAARLNPIEALRYE